ncbi:MAG: M28 family metallopeptidase [Thermoguttaceae bacterium]
MKRTAPTRLVIVAIVAIVACCLPGPGRTAENGNGNEAWNAVWQRDGVEATIGHILASVDGEQMKQNLFYLSKSPLPFRKLNITLPGHPKSTLEEADDYLAEKLQSWGYQVEREPVRVQAFRRDTAKNPHHQYSRPMPEDPWYTASNLYAERKGRSKPGETILLVAHKDSQSWIDSPGANDNAIGTVGVLEIARVLASYDSQRTIRFLLCNEEHTPWTSVTAAEKAKERGDNIVALFNLDGIGVKSPEETAAGKLPCVTAFTEPPGDQLAELVGAANDRFRIGLEHRIVKQERPGNDDGSFVKAGYKSAIIVIGSWPYADPNYHLETDIPELTDVAAAAKTLQAVVGAVLTLDLE